MPEVRKQKEQYRWYMTGIVSYVAPFGIQMILFPWLIAVRLQESADRLGIAQMATQLPGLFLILVGGMLADRIDGRKIVIVLQMLAAIPTLTIAIMIHHGYLSYPMLIVYALSAGTIHAFINPARDGMLNRVADGKLQRTVTVAMGLTFGAQMIGYALASFADQVGAVPLLLVQSTIFLFGAFAATRLTPAEPYVIREGGSGVSQIMRGLKVVWRSDRMRPAMVMLVFMSFFYGGTFMVVNPLMVRDIYGGGAFEISVLFSAFVAGTISGTIILLSVGGIRRQGLAMMLAIFGGGGFLLIGSLELPFYGYLTVIAGWGMCGAVAMSMGRTIMQESAPDDMRSRVMSVFLLCNTGGMPLGALVLGYCAKYFGVLTTLMIVVVGVWTVTIMIWLLSNLQHVVPLPSANLAAK